MSAIASRLFAAVSPGSVQERLLGDGHDRLGRGIGSATPGHVLLDFLGGLCGCLRSRLLGAKAEALQRGLEKVVKK